MNPMVESQEITETANKSEKKQVILWCYGILSSRKHAAVATSLTGREHGSLARILPGCP